jgi:hypothetical protein
VEVTITYLWGVIIETDIATTDRDEFSKSKALLTDI